MLCGFTKNANLQNNIQSNIQVNKYRTVMLYSAYLGRVQVKVGNTPNPNFVLMECTGSGISSRIVVRSVDAKISQIDPDANPTLRQLMIKRPAIINIDENKEVFFQIQTIELKKALESDNKTGIDQHTKVLDMFSKIEPLLYNNFKTKYAKIQYNGAYLRSLYIKCCVVDIHFNTSLYLEFLQTRLQRPSINNNKLLLSVFNIDHLDNAYFTGEYMVYGNGDTMFYPLTSIDVTGHELGHGIVQATANLEYEGHSGAMNEAFADIFGSSFEFWLYNKFNEDADSTNDLLGSSDWLIGEDIGKTVLYLRNMRNPETAEFPQPGTYRGEHWVDPNSVDDYGGVHTNSGVINKCFTLLCDKIKNEQALEIYYNCLLSMHPNSDFMDFRNIILSKSPSQFLDHVKSCLDAVGLNTRSVSDWKKSIVDKPVLSIMHLNTCPNSTIPTLPQCCPHCQSRVGKRSLSDEPHPNKNVKKKRAF